MGVCAAVCLGDEAWPLLQSLVDSAPTPQHAHRALMLGLHASALKVSQVIPYHPTCFSCEGQSDDASGLITTHRSLMLCIHALAQVTP